MNYTDLVARLENLVVTKPTDTAFQAIIPAVIDYAELRIHRDLDFLETRDNQVVGVLTSGIRTVSLAALGFPIIVLEQVNVFSLAGVRTTLTPQSKVFMDMVYPDTAPALPIMPVDFCMLDQNHIIVGPTPNAAYAIEVYGTIRPAPLSATNPDTWLAANLPDLYVAACMVFLSGWMKQFAGALSDDPQMPVTWESMYKTLLVGADVEEARRKQSSASWSSQKPLPTSSPART